MSHTQDRPATHFRTIQKLRLEYAPVSITQYESARTGMRAVVIDQKGPQINGYFALATEIHDDSGAPHTLEHLCFMGSKSYRYKGLLDKLATRAYSTTNAWTATDHTAYTLETAGWAGFAQILPVYLEHLIVPTLTDAGCYTEVHHVDGTGHDAGVVYSEMQGVQNTGDELMELAARRAIYPEGDGFRYETGGMMEPLRVLTADRIRAFHKAMYQPKNMCLVITGEVDHNDLLRVLDNFEDTILDDVPAIDAPFQRPWVESKRTPPLKQTTLKTVDFPEEDESMGEVLVGFLGPECNNHVANAALGVTLLYLCGSAISVLENTLVEQEQLCSMVYYHLDTRPDMTIWFQMTSIETGLLGRAESRLFELLKETVSKELNISYLHDCLKRWRRQILQGCENAASFFSTSAIEDHLFGHRDGQDLKSLQTLRELDEVEGWSDRTWRDFISKWLADAHHVSILGVPSKQLADKIASDEKARVKAQQERLGEDGLKRKADELKNAQEENDRPIPDHVLESFPVPSTDSVHFITTVTARSGAAKKLGRLESHSQQIIDRDDNGSPLFIQFEDIPSNFVRVKLYMCTSSVPVELRPLLVLWHANFFTTPVLRNGKRIEFEEVVLELERETLNYGTDSSSANGELLTLGLETEPESYEKVISWIKTLLFDAIHDPVRLRASLTKTLADIPDEKRRGDSMLYAVNSMLMYKPSSSLRACTTLTKALYLRRMLKMLKEDEQAVIGMLTRLCEALHRPENFRVYVAADLEKLAKPVSAWHALTINLDVSKPLEPLDSRKEQLSEMGKNPGSIAYLVPMPTIDSSYAALTTKGVEDYTNPDLPALMVAATYMDAVEGPLWVGVRGTGLAYGTHFSRQTDTGLIFFGIDRSPDVYKAFQASKEQVEGYASGKYAINKFALEGAISEIVLNMARDQPTMAAAAETSFTNQVLRGISKEWSAQMLPKVREVTPEQMRAAMRSYMVPAFDPKAANLVVTCATIMTEGLVENFGRAGFSPESRPLEFFQDDYGLQAPGGGDEPDDDEDGSEGDMEEDEEEEGDEDEAMDTPGSAEGEA